MGVFVLFRSNDNLNCSLRIYILEVFFSFFLLFIFYSQQFTDNVWNNKFFIHFAVGARTLNYVDDGIYDMQYI